MYNVTRQDAADALQISVRSVDRYIKSWKLRITKGWKNILIHSSDIENIRTWGKAKQHVIIQEAPAQKFSSAPQEPINRSMNETNLSTGKKQSSLETIYSDLRKEIEKKDEIIQTLALRVWKAEEIAKNSISINDFKKSQFLLEESKSAINTELHASKKQKEKLTRELQYEKQVKILFFL